jgi:Helix-turn-helix domain
MSSEPELAMPRRPSARVAIVTSSSCAEAVANALRNGDRRDLLDLALAAGFSSKASFNRAFRAAFGVTASEYRRIQGSESTNYVPFVDCETTAGLTSPEGFAIAMSRSLHRRDDYE